MVFFSDKLNYTFLLMNKTQIPGPRISPEYVSDIKTVEDNVLFIEQQRTQRIID